MVRATGGTVTTDGAYTIHTFNSDDDFIANENITAEVLVVAGGASGGWAGGAGGGIKYDSALNITAGTKAVIIGDGGTSVTADNNGVNGEDSVFTTMTAVGGGYGSKNTGGNVLFVGGTGANGGGGVGNPGGHGTGTDGYDGGDGSNPVSGYALGGGGGGGDAVGNNSSGNAAGAGGAGKYYSISGSSIAYSGGGGGGADSRQAAYSAGAGGVGGGGAGSKTGTATSGTNNLGGGGGGSTYNSGYQSSGAGGSGVVIIRYVTISPVPVANFTGTPLSGVTSISTVFTDTSTETPTSWSWKKNGVEFSTSQNPTETFTVGNYTIKLTATNAGGSDDEEKINYINVSKTWDNSVNAYTRRYTSMRNKNVYR